MHEVASARGTAFSFRKLALPEYHSSVEQGGRFIHSRFESSVAGQFASFLYVLIGAAEQRHHFATPWDVDDMRMFTQLLLEALAAAPVTSTGLVFAGLTHAGLGIVRADRVCMHARHYSVSREFAMSVLRGPLWPPHWHAR